MLRNFKIISLSHKHVPLNMLSHLMVKHETAEELKDQLFALRDTMGIRELLYLATCNRVLFLIDLPGPLHSSFLSSFCAQINPSFQAEEHGEVFSSIQVLEGPKAINHLFEVAASIDSMVVGEREILRQLREAYQQCKGWGLTGDNIRLAMKTAVESAKEVYDKTRIGEKPISVVSLAIQSLLKSQLAKDARILLIGAGQTNTLVAKFLTKHEFRNVSIFNRSFDKAEKLANMTGGKAIPLSLLDRFDEGFDCIISCTGHTQSWIDSELYSHLLQEDTAEKLVIDLAVPNNITTEVRTAFAINYVEVDALRQLANENMAFREQETHHARQFLEQNLAEFHHLVQERSIEKAMHEVPQEIKAVKAHAINQVFKKELDVLDPQARDLLERMMNYMEKRCISIPMQAAKKTVKQIQ